MGTVHLPAATPIVSIVIATYNRSYTLRHAIQSVCNSSLTAWEVIVVGDACTDDTAMCVEAFGDPRIRFVNLPDRCGDQSGPNSHGVAISRGKYVAFLNHDDFYFPDHLENCVNELETSGADLVWVPCVIAGAPTEAAQGHRQIGLRIVGVPIHDGYSPLSFYAATSWVLRRTLAENVGPWCAPNDTFMLPSQEWLYRASRTGATLRFLPRTGVIKMAVLPNCYLQRESPEHDLVARMMKDNPNFRENIIEDAAIAGARERENEAFFPSFLTVMRLFRRPIYALFTAFGINPVPLNNALRSRRRGGDVQTHRRRTGSD